ncbi:exonuclease [Candidatus Woesearchaeota archaeon CG10_big_fil_rev_8_21_14_0_10_44_13]|nr:MAG: exonuclease [Candidatus Woesearchaeota archaeon CG10_big_fil_rev_8_21_14_0_10_44_13]
MIRNSFIFLDRISKNAEKRIWQQGIDSWDSFIEAKRIDGISGLRKGHYDRQIDEARRHLYSMNSAYFTNMLTRGETWRLYPFFKEDAVFLDIETTGYYGNITVIGLYDGIDTKMMIKGVNLDKEIIKKELSKYKLIVTFNGSSFDLPVIERYFQGVVPYIPHIDLRHVCSKIGLTGGLKSIERQLNIKRLPELDNVTGEDAAKLWRVFRATGDEYYLNLLLKYNEEDIINLKTIADFAVKGLWRKTRYGENVDEKRNDGK